MELRRGPALPLAAFFLAVALLAGTAGAMEVSEVSVDYPLAPALGLPPGPEGASPGPALASTVAPRAGWEESWFAYRENVRRGNAAGGEEQLAKTILFRQERGIPDLPAPAAALLYEAAQAAQQKRFEDALRLTDLARKLSPSDPATHFLRASVIFRENRLHVLSSLEAWLDGWAALFRDYRSFFPWLLNQAVWLTGALLLSAVIFILVQAYQVFPHLAHDLSHFTGGMAWPWYILPPLALVACLLTGLGFLWWLLAVPLALVFHLRPRERLSLAVGVALLASLPALILALTLGKAYHGPSPSRVLFEVERAGDGLNGMAALKPFLEGATDPRFPLAAALLHKRAGDLAGAEMWLGKAAALSPQNPAVLNNLGNVMLLTGRVDDAIRQYQAAIKLSEDARIHFNLSQAYRANLQLEEGERELSTAQSLDPGTLSQYTSVTLEGGLSPTADITGTMKDSVSSLLAPTGDALAFRDALWKEILPGIPFGSAIPLFLGAALALLVSFPLAGWLEPSSRCGKCGRLFCVRCTRPNKEGICAQCNQVFVVRTGVDPAHRVRKMIQIMKFKKRTILQARVSTVLFPGAGHTLLGHPWPGLMFIFLTSAFWTKWITWHGVYRPATRLPLVDGLAGQVFFFMLFGLCYLVALRGIGNLLEEE